MDGSQVGPLGIKVADLTDEVWNYIFLKGAYPQGCNISEENLHKLRYEFEYWYPMDLRCSGKDLIRNHLTMSLYNHAAIWEDQKYMPRGFFCNGYIQVNGEKMSKSKGNFRTMSDCISLYGVDATRVALADAGDSLDDANFDEQVANSAILRLYVLEKWIKDEIKEQIPDGGLDFSQKQEYDTWDNILENEINLAIENTTTFYREIKYKQALKQCFFELSALKEDYLIAKKGKMNPFLLMKFVETFLILINPICPHFAEYCWATHVLPVYEKSTNVTKQPAKFLFDQGWTTTSKGYDKLYTRMYEYMKSVKGTVRTSMDKAKSGGKKVKGGKQQKTEKEDEKQIKNCIVFVAKKYPDWKEQVLEMLQGDAFDADDKALSNIIKEKIAVPKLAGEAMKFAKFVINDAKVVGKENALQISMPFDEIELIDKNRDFVFENMNTLENIQIKNAADEVEQESSKQTRDSSLPGKPTAYFF